MEPVTALDATIMTFKEILKELDGGGNLVLGGSQALLLHGLQVPHTPEDLDIIIYSPTGNQRKYLRSLSDLTVENEVGSAPDRRSFKFQATRNGIKYTLDILIDEGIPTPKHLLQYHKAQHGIKVRVQSIMNIVAAKVRYGREKDYKHLQCLKNMNFNA